MANNILNDSVTYESLIDSAATSLYNKLKNHAIYTSEDNPHEYRFNSVSFVIGSGVTCGHKRATKVSQAKTVTLKEQEVINVEYIPPSKETIVSDIKTFMREVNVPIDNTNPTPDGAISFFFALNFFVEKAVIKRPINAPQGGNVITYHLHYEAPSALSYSYVHKIPYNYKIQNTITTEKINNIYNQLKTTNLLSDDVRNVSIIAPGGTSSHTSSCSSSSCSSVFIAYYNLN